MLGPRCHSLSSSSRSLNMERRHSAFPCSQKFSGPSRARFPLPHESLQPPLSRNGAVTTTPACNGAASLFRPQPACPLPAAPHQDASRVLAELLPRLSIDGHRVLIFSQWTQMLDILEWALEVIGVTYRRLDGSTKVNERQTIVDTFNNDPSIFACLLSTRAGGQGLNLVGADTVIIHDMDFNPQMDRQAEDRCHRIGQANPVTIYRLVTRGTVDENIYEIARRKLVLDAAILQTGAEMENGDVPQKTMGEILSSLLLI